MGSSMHWPLLRENVYVNRSSHRNGTNKLIFDLTVLQLHLGTLFRGLLRECSGISDIFAPHGQFLASYPCSTGMDLTSERFA